MGESITGKVRQIPVSYAVPGMKMAEDVYNSSDMLVIAKNSLLTDKVISKMMFFDIISIHVYNEEPVAETPSQEPKEEVEDEEQHRFHENYDATLSDVKDVMNNLVEKNEEIDEDRLIEDVEFIVRTSTNRMHLMQMLHKMKDYDDETYKHMINVSLLCNIFADWLNLNEQYKKVLTLCGLLHDVGKLLIPKNILNKPGKLTDEEYQIIKSHPLKGYEFLKERDVPEAVKFAALQHHERRDGKGYPYGAKGEDLNPFAEITSIADVYEAMTSTRVYRTSVCPFEVIRIFETEGFGQFNPTFIIPLLHKIAESYLNNKVLLNDGREGYIRMLNNNELARPIIQSEDAFINLSTARDLSIKIIE